MAFRINPIGFLPGFLALGLLAAQAQISLTGTSSVGPFTQEQVDRGRVAYNAACGACHGINLRDGSHRTPLTGSSFLAGWGWRTTAEYLRYVQARMPYREPGTLAPETYADIVAFILAANGAQPGNQLLTAESAVRIDTIADGMVRDTVLADHSQPQ